MSRLLCGTAASDVYHSNTVTHEFIKVTKNASTSPEVLAFLVYTWIPGKIITRSVERLINQCLLVKPRYKYL